MKTKEKVIRKSMESVNRQLKKIDDLLKATPMKDMLSILSEEKRIMDSYWRNEISYEEFLNSEKAINSRYKKAEALYEKTKDSIPLLNKKFALERELDELQVELIYVQFYDQL